MFQCAMLAASRTSCPRDNKVSNRPCHTLVTLTGKCSYRNRIVIYPGRLETHDTGSLRERILRSVILLCLIAPKDAG
eukprot:COSAG06_NODE_71_length_25945_cov_9.124468_24_plen_77_part_00